MGEPSAVVSKLAVNPFNRSDQPAATGPYTWMRYVAGEANCCWWTSGEELIAPSYHVVAGLEATKWRNKGVARASCDSRGVSSGETPAWQPHECWQGQTARCPVATRRLTMSLKRDAAPPRPWGARSGTLRGLTLRTLRVALLLHIPGLRVQRFNPAAGYPATAS